MASLERDPFAWFSELTFMTIKKSVSVSFSSWICALRKVKGKAKDKVKVKSKIKFKLNAHR